MEDKIFSILVDKDELTWQTIIMDLVKSEEINPWDVNISNLTKKYINLVKKMKELDLRISGKVLLAAAVLLKIKSSRLVGEDIDELDRLMAGPDDQTEDEFYDGLMNEEYRESIKEGSKGILIPRTPQPRKRKVSVYDLMDALQKALEVKKRRVIREIPPAPEVMVPEKKIDITIVISDIFSKIKNFIGNNNEKKLVFDNLLTSEVKSDKVSTFVPLLYLSNQGKIELFQESHFGDIEIRLNDGKSNDVETDDDDST